MTAQIEARRLSGVDVGKRVQGSDSEGEFDGVLVRVAHDGEANVVDLRVRERRMPGVVTLAPSDLVTVTGRGQS